MWQRRGRFTSTRAPRLCFTKSCAGSARESQYFVGKPEVGRGQEPLVLANNLGSLLCHRGGHPFWGGYLLFGELAQFFDLASRGTEELYLGGGGGGVSKGLLWQPCARKMADACGSLVAADIAIQDKSRLAALRSNILLVSRCMSWFTCSLLWSCMVAADSNSEGTSYIPHRDLCDGRM